MSRSRIRSCPKCREVFAVTIAEAGGQGQPIEIFGHCVVCGYDMAWHVFLGRPSTRTRAVRAFALITLIFVAAATMIRCAPADAPEDLTIQWAG